MPSMSTDDKLSEEDDEMDDEESTEGSDASSQESSNPDGTQETASESEAASSSSSSHGVKADCAITPHAQSIEQRIHASESVRNMPHDEAIELDSGMEEQRVTPIKEDRRVYSHSHNASAQKLGSVPSLSFKMVHNAPHDEAMVLEDDEVMNTPPPSKVGKTSNSCIEMGSSLEDMNHSHNGTALRDARLIENDLHDEEVHLDGEYMKTPPEQFLMSSSRHHHIQNERSATRNPTLLQNTSHDEAISVNDTEEHRTPTPPELLLSDRQLKSSDTSQVIPGVGHTIRSEGSQSHGLRNRGRSDRSSSTSSSSSSTTSSESSHPAGDASAGMQDHASRNYKSHSGDVNRKQTSPVVDETASSKAGVATPSYDPKEYLNLNVSREVKDLFLTITNFQPTIVELQAKLIPFLPDYIPAVGDIDTFCKIPRPDEKPDNLGLTVVDEPCANQSNPAVIDISLTYQIKQHVRPSFVDSIEDAQNKPSAIQRWIDDIRSIHSKNPPPTVAYSKAMPDIEKLMQAWPPEIEELLSNGEVLPTAELDVDLVQYIKILCAFLDIPTYTNLVESLHVMFTLYHEFKNNQHFHQRAAI